MTSDRDFVTHELETSVREFFEAYGVECSVDDSVAPLGGPEMGSIVGFKGAAVRGGLAFVAPADFVAKLLPVPRQDARADMQLRDWSAEIANQLVGRLKNKLSARSIDFDVGSPVCFRGSSIRLSFLPECDGVTLAFRTGEAPVRVYLDCALVEREPDASAALRIVPEGEVLLF